MDADFAAIERRVLAMMFGPNRDPHTLKAMEIYGVTADKVTPEMRQRAKNANYLEWYTNDRSPV